MATTSASVAPVSMRTRMMDVSLPAIQLLLSGYKSGRITLRVRLVEEGGEARQPREIIHVSGYFWPGKRVSDLRRHAAQSRKRCNRGGGELLDRQSQIPSRLQETRRHMMSKLSSCRIRDNLARSMVQKRTTTESLLNFRDYDSFVTVA